MDQSNVFQLTIEHGLPVPKWYYFAALGLFVVSGLALGWVLSKIRLQGEDIGSNSEGQDDVT